MVAAAISRGDVIIENIVPDHLKTVSAKLREAGVEISEELSSIHVKASGSKLKAVDIKTLPYPGFPTDMQAKMTSLMRSEERRVGKECVSTCRFRGSRCP